MTWLNGRTLIGLCAAGLLTGTALAGRPFVTEDAGVLVRGECEAEAVWSRWKAREQPTFNAAATQVACGAPADSQLGLAFAHERGAGETAESLGLNGKTRLPLHALAPAQFGLAWGVATLKAPGRSHTLDALYLNLAASHTHAGGWTTHANLGTSRSRVDRQDSTTWALAVEKTIGAGVDLGAETYGDDRSPAWLGVGVRWAVGESVSLNASWARQGGGDGGRLLSVGAKLAF